MSSAGSVTHRIRELEAANHLAAQKLGYATATIERRLRLIRRIWEKEMGQ